MCMVRETTTKEIIENKDLIKCFKGLENELKIDHQYICLSIIDHFKEEDASEHFSTTIDGLFCDRQGSKYYMRFFIGDEPSGTDTDFDFETFQEKSERQGEELHNIGVFELLERYNSNTEEWFNVNMEDDIHVLDHGTYYMMCRGQNGEWCFAPDVLRPNSHYVINGESVYFDGNKISKDLPQDDEDLYLALEIELGLPTRYNY